MLQKNIHNKVTVGTWITLAHPSIAEIMAASGFDWIAIDLEHSVITIREAEELIRVINLSGVTSLVRLTSNDPNQIKRIMDAGSCGIIVPMVKSVDDVKQAVAAVKYPPYGNRSVGLARAQDYGRTFIDYLEWQKSQSIVIIQIEHIEAVNNLESIFNIDGVDGYIIGPYDLSASLGIPGEFDNPLFLDAMSRVKKVASDMKIMGGIHIIEPDPDQLQMRINEGYQFIAYSLDIRMIDSVCKEGLNILERTKNT